MIASSYTMYIRKKDKSLINKTKFIYNITDYKILLNISKPFRY